MSDRDKLAGYLGHMLMTPDSPAVVDVVGELIDKARELVRMLDEAETHHGGLLTVGMLTAKNQLRTELIMWPK